jgi:hypothetical protein
MGDLSSTRRCCSECLLLRRFAKRQSKPPLEQPAPFEATWGLRCGPGNRFRVFYAVDADSKTVQVLAIGVKDRNRLFIEGEEYEP